MSAVHFVSATAPPDTSKASVAAKQLSEILARQCGSEVQRVASWQCMDHGLEGAIVMTFTNTEAVRRTSLWVMQYRKEYSALKDKGPPMEAYWGGPTADKALRKANELDVLFLRNKMPGLQEMKWVTEEDDLVAQDEDFKAVVTSVGIMSTDGAVVRVVVQDGGPDVDSQQIVITSVVIQLDYEELLQKSSPAELQKQKEKMMASRWSILS